MNRTPSAYEDGLSCDYGYQTAVRTNEAPGRGYDFRPDAEEERPAFWPIWSIIAVLVVAAVFAGALGS